MKKISPILIVGLLCFSMSSILSPQVEAQIEEPTLVWSEEIQLTFGAGSDFWPCVVQDLDGKIWLVFISDQSGNRALYIKSSVDGGETWTIPEMLVEDNLSTIGINIQRSSAFIDSKDTMWIAWQSQRTVSGGDAEIWHITSTDGGNTWSEPEKPYVGSSPWNGYYDPFVIEAFDKIWIFFQHYSSGHDRTWCFSSDDYGNTWSSRTGVTSETVSRGHPSAVLIGNELWLVYDSHFSSSPSWPESAIYLMKTTDGVSWSPEQQVTTPLLAEQFPSIAKYIDDKIYIFFDYKIGSERSIQYTYSTDDGASWSSPETLTDGVSTLERSPGQTVAIIDGNLWVVYANDSKIRLKYARANQPPVADFRFRGPKTSFSPSTIYVESEVKFDAEPSYDPDGFIVSFTWDFGDGTTTTETEEVVYHVFPWEGWDEWEQPQVFTVTLTVIDKDGASNTISKDVFIHPYYWELIVEIDYMEGYEPSWDILSYIERYFRDNGIFMTLVLDEEVPIDNDGVTDDDFWAYEWDYNNLGDDKTWYDIFGIRQYVFDSKWKWALFGNWDAGFSTGFSFNPDTNTDYGNYIFIPKKYIDEYAPTYGEKAETTAFMHELGHAIGILVLDENGEEDYDNVPWSVMAPLSAHNYLADRIRYSHRYWKEKNLEYYEI